MISGVMVDFEFDIHSDLKPELDETYSKLEVIVNRIKKIRERLVGFKDIVDSFQPITQNLTVLFQTLDPDVARVIKLIASIFLGLLTLLVIFPLLSGITKLPWMETLVVILAVIGMAFINVLKEKLGVV